MVYNKIQAKSMVVGLLLIFSFLITLYIYFLFAKSGVSETGNDNPRQSTYNLLVDGFRSGQLNLKKEAPVGLVHLANPYDSKTNAVYRNLLTYRLNDTSFYRGKLYIYYGATPALLLFWPWAALTGHYLFHQEAAAIFCAMGFLTNLALLHDIKRRYFENIAHWIMVPLALAMGLSSGIPILLARADIWEVPICCAYLLTSLVFAATWFSIHQRTHRSGWLAAASLACGLAVGARPTTIFYAAVLIIPVIFYLRENRGQKERRQAWKLLIPALIPLTVCGIGIATYNYLRFGNPLEFGMKYLLAGLDYDRHEMFRANCFWYNIKNYLWSAARFTTHSPFVEKPLAMKSPPAGYWGVENIFGILVDTPIVWLMFALPLAWTGRRREGKFPLQLLGATVIWGGLSTFLLLCFYIAAVNRYEAEFLPPCILLSAVAILGLERINRNLLVMRTAWIALLCFSAAFNVLYGMHIIADYNRMVGANLLEDNLPALATDRLYKAVAFAPDDAESHNILGVALALSGHPAEAEIEFMRAVEIDPDNAKYRINRNQLHRQSPANLQVPPLLSEPPGNRSP
jgi:hypothetical protein